LMIECFVFTLMIISGSLPKHFAGKKYNNIQKLGCRIF